MKFKSETLSDFNKARTVEWLETNGLGGYASSTASGAHSRRYHGLLVPAMNPPVGRGVAISKLDETLVVDGHRYELSANQYPGTIHPQGHLHLKEFTRGMFPEFVYEVGGVELKKTIVAVHGENTVVIIYEVVKAELNFKMELLPLYAYRDFHAMAHANDSIGSNYLFQDGIFQTVNYKGCPEIFISVPASIFEESKHWYHNFEYSVEQYRGLEFREDLYTHGKFQIELKKGSKLGVILSLENPSQRSAFELFDLEKARRMSLTEKFTHNTHLERLALAADQFIVKRDNLKTIIAGYHWFSDWGRDTMIALPGLCLVTGRFDDAKSILKAFSESVSDGMLPNRFPDYGEHPEYNTIDATLWFFNATYQYVKYSADFEFAKTMLPILTEIIDWHHKGTRYNIKVDEKDGLLAGGNEHVQLTWMDAKVGDWVVTPRKGKPVEINALWYNALCILSDLYLQAGDNTKSLDYQHQANRVKSNFENTFLNKSIGCLYDFVDDNLLSEDIRPNQIYVLSLPFPVIEKDNAEYILSAVEHYLLTPRGLRSLNPQHNEYKPTYGGGVWSRDGSYHQGTVWSFLVGPYIDALIRNKGVDGRKSASKLLNTFLETLDEACIGSVSEIFDGDHPHHPRGCVAQAWSVGEILRAAVEHDLLK